MNRPYFKLILTLCWVLQLGAQTAPRVLIFADQEYSRLQIKVKGGSYTLRLSHPILFLPWNTNLTTFIRFIRFVGIYA